MESVDFFRQQFTQFAIDHLSVAQYWMDADARFVYVNDAASAALGYTREELLQKTVFDIDPDFPPAVWYPQWEVLRRDKTSIVRSRHRTKAGRFFPIEVTANFVIFNGQEFNCAFVRDITDLVKADEERLRLERLLIQSEKMSAVGQLAAGVAHEINNPLGVILGFTEGLLQDVQETAEQHAPLQAIKREALRCKNLVADLLIFARERPWGMELKSPSAVIEGALLLIEPQARIRRVEVRRDFESGLPAIPVDQNQIQQVIINLCTNAFDAMPNGGTLTIALARRQDHVEMRVTDTGTGIPPEIQDRIFEPFFTTKNIGHGTGLGLSLVYETIQKHHGRIDVKSAAGQGATFTVHLPIASIG